MAMIAIQKAIFSFHFNYISGQYIATRSLKIKCKENHGADFCSMITFFLNFKYFCAAFLYQLVRKKNSWKDQVELFQNFDRVHILEGSYLRFRISNEGTRAKAEYGNGG